MLTVTQLNKNGNYLKLLFLIYRLRCRKEGKIMDRISMETLNLGVAMIQGLLILAQILAQSIWTVAKENPAGAIMFIMFLICSKRK